MKTIALIVLMLASSGLSAAQLYTENSKQGESVDDFMVRVAPRAVAYTLVHNVEVCGMIYKTDNTYAISIGTENSNNACSMPVPAGSIGLTFHTHPSPIAFKFHDKDFSVPGYLGTVCGVRFQNGVGTEKFVGRYSERITNTLRQQPSQLTEVSD